MTASDRVAPVASSRGQGLRPDIEKALRTVDPSRVYQTAKAGRDVPALVPVGPSEHRIQPGKQATLAVQAVPDEVVTFASRDGGLFPNHLASITVLADETGIARTVLTANPGTVDDIAVRAGSPAATGTLTLIVHVVYPQSPLVTAAQPQP